MNDKKAERLQRQFLRAPLKAKCLYVDGEYVFTARIQNISEGGLLLCELPHLPEINALPLSFDLPQFPKLQTLTFDQIKLLKMEEFPRMILKTKCRIMRSFEGQSNVDKVFTNFIGCEFYTLDPELAKVICSYVETFIKNIVYFLSLFESGGNRAEQVDLLRKVASLLGYDHRLKIPLLRAKVLHDYHSLESL